MRGQPKRGLGPLVPPTLILGVLIIATPVSAQNQSLRTCGADAGGEFSCLLRMPPDAAGESNVVSRCPTATTASSEYPPTSETVAATSTGPLGVSSNRLNPGQEFRASGNGCGANSLVTFTLTGTALAREEGTRTLTARVTVVDPGARTGGAGGGAAGRGSLARTGLQALPWLTAGLVALGLGGGFLFAGRRSLRKKSQAAT